MNTKVNCCPFTNFQDLIFNLLSGFINNFFNSRRMDSSICHELMKSQSGYFPAYRVEG